MISAQPNQSLIDGLACLQALTSSSAPIGSRAMARHLGLEVTRVNRLLKTLAYLGLAEQDERRAYRPGPGIHVLAAQSLLGSALLGRAIKPLESLRSHGYVVALGVLWRTQTCYLYHAAPSDDTASALGHERLFPAVNSGIGMAILAQRTNEEVLDTLASVNEPPPGGADVFVSRLDEIRSRGWALVNISDDSHRTLAVPLDGHSQAAIGLSGSFRDHQLEELLEALRTAASGIAAAGA